MKVIANVISNCLTNFLNIGTIIKIGLLSIIILFIFALLGMQLFGGNLILGTNRLNCDDIGHAFLWGFQIMSL